jgi:formate dehydrogenase assembly factor FdhD
LHTVCCCLYWLPNDKERVAAGLATSEAVVQAADARQVVLVDEACELDQLKGLFDSVQQP